jgi:hypothetical protein
MQLDRMVTEQQVRGFARLRATAQLACDAMETEPEYARALILSTARPASSAVVLERGFNDMYGLGLVEMAEDGLISATIDLSPVVPLIRAMTLGLYVAWARSQVPTEVTRQRVTLGMTVLVNGLRLGDALDGRGPDFEGALLPPTP